MKIANIESTVPYYEVYQGNSKHCLKGRFVMGNSRIMFSFSFSYLNSITLLILFRMEIQISFIVLQLLLLLLTDYLMIKTTFIDPGKIPRINSQFQNFPECYLIPHKQHYGIEIVQVTQCQIQEIKFCDRCQIFKTQSTAHCRRCDNCVQGFDHHCIWLGQCIGQRNYSTFYFFICSLTITLLFLLGLQIHNIIGVSGIIILEKSFYILQTLGFVIFAIYLTILHTYFILTNKTTYGFLTTNRFVVNHHNSLFYFGDGALFIRRFTRAIISIWHKLIKSKRAEFIPFSKKIYYEMPSYIEQQQVQQKLQFMMSSQNTEKINIEEKTKTLHSDMNNSEKINIENRDQKQDEFKFLKIESDSNQFSQESSHRGEKEELKTFGMSQSQHIKSEFNPNIVKQVKTGKHSRQYEKLEFLSNKKNEIKILQIDQLG